MSSDESTLRKNEPWVEQTEQLLQRWCDASRIQAEKHDAAGNACKRSHIRWGLPNALIPVIVAPVAAVVERDTVWWFHYAEAALILATGACGVMTNFFSFAAKAEKHFAFASRYMDLVTDIEAEMAKPREYRQQADTFTLRSQMIFDALNRAAPDV